jgi:hypothetical protein
MDRMHNGRWTQLGDPEFNEYIRSELERAFTVLSSGGAVVAFVSAPYYLRGERPDGGRWPEDDPERVDAMNAIIRGVVAAHPGRAALVDLNAHTSTTNEYTRSVDGVVLRSDGVHFTPQGARWLAPWLLPALHELGPASRAPAVTSSTTSTIRSTTTSRPVRTTTTVATTRAKRTSKVPPELN